MAQLIHFHSGKFLAKIAASTFAENALPNGMRLLETTAERVSARLLTDGFADRRLEGCR